jgi:hypothetical protein
MRCTGGTCVATSGHAVMNVGDLMTMLGASNVTLRTGRQAVGLFHLIAPGAQVRDIHLKQTFVLGQGSVAVGTLAGNNQGTVANSSSSGSAVVRPGLLAGGLSNCFATGAVHADHQGYGGGLIGINAGVAAAYYSSGAVTGHRDRCSAAPMASIRALPAARRISIGTSPPAGAATARAIRATIPISPVSPTNS